MYTCSLSFAENFKNFVHSKSHIHAQIFQFAYLLLHVYNYIERMCMYMYY